MCPCDRIWSVKSDVSLRGWSIAVPVVDTPFSPVPLKPQLIVEAGVDVEVQSHMSGRYSGWSHQRRFQHDWEMNFCCLETLRFQNCLLLKHNIAYPAYYVACACSVAELCPTLCNPMDLSLPGSSVHGVFQARVLQWGAISYPRGSSWPRDQNCVSCINRRILYQCTT